ncbi:MAG: hypothetical protein AB1513_01240 [Pseudomonadota bacterium]
MDIQSGRRALAHALLDCPPSKLQQRFSQEFYPRIAELHTALKSLFFLLEATQEDEPILNRIKKWQENGHTQPTDARMLIVALFYLAPYQIKSFPPIATIPQWLLEFVFKSICLRSLDAFRYRGEIREHCDTLLWLTDETHKIIHDPNLLPDHKNLVARVYASTMNPIPFYFLDDDLAAFYKQRSAIVEFFLASQKNTTPLDYQFPATPPATEGNKIRLGILAHHFGPQTETYSTLAVYHDLDRSRFDITLIADGPFGNHPLEQYCSRHADRTVVLPKHPGQAVEAIRKLDLDAIWISPNMTGNMGSVLATTIPPFRLARVQITGGNSPATTGFHNIDYFVSGTYTEPADAQSHYTEKLLLVDGPAHCFVFDESAAMTSGVKFSREAAGIPQDALIFVSGANFYKITPEQEDVWLAIIRQVPGSRLLLYPFNPNWNADYQMGTFFRRLDASIKRLGLGYNPIILQRPMPYKADILELLKLGDVYLDSFPHTGMTSLLDPLHVHLPVVVQEGNSQRARMSASALRALGLEHRITRSVEEYSALAIKLATDTAAREQYRQELEQAMQTTPKFLDSKWFGSEISRILEEVTGHNRQGAHP